VAIIQSGDLSQLVRGTRKRSFRCRCPTGALRSSRCRRRLADRVRDLSAARTSDAHQYFFCRFWAVTIRYCARAGKLPLAVTLKLENVSPPISQPAVSRAARRRPSYPGKFDCEYLAAKPNTISGSLPKSSRSHRQSPPARALPRPFGAWYHAT